MLSRVIKIMAFCLAGLFVGVFLALLIWVFGSNPIKKIDGVSLYTAKAPFRIIISNEEFNVDSDLFLYQKDEDAGSSKYFVFVREEN
jgi:hypothetical protein